MEIIIGGSDGQPELCFSYGTEAQCIDAFNFIVSNDA